MEFDTYLAFAHRLADLSAEAILPHFRHAPSEQNKPGQAWYDPVTEADREAERRLRALVSERFPDHGFIGEEYGADKAEADYCWVVDPIDGTLAFIIGAPVWTTLIALLHKGEPLLGIVNQPFIGERYWTEMGVSRYRGPDGEAYLRTRSCARLEDAVLSTTAMQFLSAGYETQAFEALSAKVRMTRMGYDAYAYALLAAGHIDIVLEAGLNVYDIAPLIPLIRHAGGVVTGWEGENPAKGGRILACGDPRLHETVLEILAELAPDPGAADT